ncbi:M48 family metalloprotease [Microvirga sp. SYSU G3D207]|uniref:M48 family metalloprotease n=1 Tax=Microvirga arsenatis TaxID=2692265 RepID=A0ABW9YYH4_9HYPH|nr:M48 family metalloprotease [Microvirga arsenatis]NBJ24168.1 M48 family metalloprotease [Microvirga arsenatis]
MRAAAIAAVMRRESRLRTWLLLLIVSVVPSLLVGTSFPFTLTDLLLPLGPPLSHMAHAGLLFAGTFCILLIMAAELTRRKVRVPESSPGVGPTVSHVLQDLARRVGIEAEAQPFGGLRSRGIEAVAVGRRRIVRIATARLREVNTHPEAFRFTLAHELAHLAAGDPRADRWIACAYLAASVFMLVTFGSVLWEVGSTAATAWRFGPDAVAGSLRVAALPLAANAMSMGTLALLLFFERRSAMRLREFHADAVATALVGPGASAIDRLQGAGGGALTRWVRRLVSDHPEKHFRRRALSEHTVAFQADRILFVLQGYFAATVIEMLLQVLFVNASPNVSTLAERQQQLFLVLEHFPLTVTTLMVAAALLTFVSGLLVFRRVKVLADAAGARQVPARLVTQVPLLVGVGVGLALVSSQTVLWELSSLGWRLDAVVEADPDRASVYAAYLLGVVAAILLIIGDKGRWSLTRGGTAALAALPVAFALSAGLRFYIR